MKQYCCRRVPLDSLSVLAMRHLALTALLLALAARASAHAQAPASLDWWSDDSSRITFVTAHGQARRYPDLVIWALTDSLDPGWFPPFADSLATSLRALRTLLGGPRSWQRIGQRPLVYYLSPGRFISHATG